MSKFLGVITICRVCEDDVENPKNFDSVFGALSRVQFLILFFFFFLSLSLSLPLSLFCSLPFCFSVLSRRPVASGGFTRGACAEARVDTLSTQPPPTPLSLLAAGHFSLSLLLWWLYIKRTPQNWNGSAMLQWVLAADDRFFLFSGKKRKSPKQQGFGYIFCYLVKLICQIMPAFWWRSRPKSTNLGKNLDSLLH